MLRPHRRLRGPVRVGARPSTVRRLVWTRAVCVAWPSGLRSPSAYGPRWLLVASWLTFLAAPRNFTVAVADALVDAVAAGCFARRRLPRSGDRRGDGPSLAQAWPARAGHAVLGVRRRDRRGACRGQSGFNELDAVGDYVDTARQRLAERRAATQSQARRRVTDTRAASALASSPTCGRASAASQGAVTAQVPFISAVLVVLVVANTTAPWLPASG